MALSRLHYFFTKLKLQPAYVQHVLYSQMFSYVAVIWILSNLLFTNIGKLLIYEKLNLKKSNVLTLICCPK